MRHPSTFDNRCGIKIESSSKIRLEGQINLVCVVYFARFSMVMDLLWPSELERARVRVRFGQTSKKQCGKANGFGKLQEPT